MSAALTPTVDARTTLAGITGPADLRALPAAALAGLAAQIRAELVETVSRTGGHLGPNLGVVELTIALHRVFHSPYDAIVWDTGHQSYVHKMLTGRREALAGLRSPGGLSGYPNRSESEHDLVENSHASTALSYADGLSKAHELRGEGDRAVVAVVGDGALTGGMCWEAMNNIAAAPDRPVVIVLNDNARSYAPTVGAVAAHLAALRTRPVGAGPVLFEQLGFCYLGPVDGHDIEAVDRALRRARRIGRPVVVHCITQKGRGHPAAERDEADRLHSIGPSCPGTLGPAASSWTQVFGEELRVLGRHRRDLVAVTAAMLRPAGLHPFATEFPDRVFDVGIAEQHAVTSAAGLAMGGLHPVVAIYATFLNRAFDQVLMDVGLHRLPVTFVLDRAGLTGSDGPSHNGMWDLSMLAIVPGLRVAAPRDAAGLRDLLGEAVRDEDGPTAIRFPKASAGRELPAVERVGAVDVLARPPGADVLLVGVGPLAGLAVDAAEQLARVGVRAAVMDPRWVQPVDPDLIAAAAGYRLVVTIEDNGAAGGFGDAVARALRGARVPVEVLSMALDQEFLAHGERGDLLAWQGLSRQGVVAGVLRRLRPSRARALG